MLDEVVCDTVIDHRCWCRNVENTPGFCYFILFFYFFYKFNQVRVTCVVHVEEHTVFKSGRVKEKAADSALFSCSVGPQPVLPCLFRPSEKGLCSS